MSRYVGTRTRRGPKEDHSVSSFDSGYDIITKTTKTLYTKTPKTISRSPSLRKSDPDSASEEQRLPAHQQSQYKRKTSRGRRGKRRIYTGGQGQSRVVARVALRACKGALQELYALRSEDSLPWFASRLSNQTNGNVVIRGQPTKGGQSSRSSSRKSRRRGRSTTPRQSQEKSPAARHVPVRLIRRYSCGQDSHRRRTCPKKSPVGSVIRKSSRDSSALQKAWRVGSVNPVIPAPSSRASSITPEASKSSHASSPASTDSVAPVPKSPPVDSVTKEPAVTATTASPAVPLVQSPPVDSIEKKTPATPTVPVVEKSPPVDSIKESPTIGTIGFVTEDRVVKSVPTDQPVPIPYGRYLNPYFREEIEEIFGDSLKATL
ncbi:hypothetical protein ACRALDRAFT_1057870 [Sodiomyces alcalophilus JCM 7366]|uniref:uncharacterized protein n=1 Tax=Sodiomyces alcalophilus JCM 7366 TaxID=591952 RepID=UPI0039B4F240